MIDMDKFKMVLTWHNCETCPPEEDYNDELYVTDGVEVYHVEYSKDRGWWSWGFDDYFTKEELRECWWADLRRTLCEFGEVF